MEHDELVDGAVFSKDETKILSWSPDKTVRLWNASTGKQLGLTMNHDAYVKGAAFSHDERRILSWSDDKTVRLWDATTGKQLGPSMHHQAPVEGAAFSPDEQLVLSWSSDKSVRLWDITTSQQIGPAMMHEDKVRSSAFSPGVSAQFSPDGSQILSASQKTVRFWDVKTGQQIGPSIEHDDAVFGPVVAHNECPIHSWSMERTIRFRDLINGQQLGSSPQSAGYGPQFSSDGNRMLSWGAVDLRVCDTQTGRLIAPPIIQPAGVDGAAFLAGGTRVLSWLNDGTLRVWDIDYPNGNLLEVACAELPDTSLTDTLQFYSLKADVTDIEPICVKGKPMTIPTWDKIEREPSLTKRRAEYSLPYVKLNEEQ